MAEEPDRNLLENQLKSKKKQKQGFGTGAGFKPGVSGNPAGRPPKDRCIPDILRKIGNGKVRDFNILPSKLKAELMKLGEDITVEEARNAMRYLYSLKGDSWASDSIDIRTEGKVPQALDIAYKDKTNADLVEMISDLVNRLEDSARPEGGQVG